MSAASGLLRRVLDVTVGAGIGAALAAGAANAMTPREIPAAPPEPSSTADDALAAARRVCPHGLPSSENIRTHHNYCASVNYRLRIPNWVAEHLTAAEVDDPTADRKHSRFKEDASVPASFRAGNEDYRNSNLSRGHLAPAGAHKTSQAALDETFLLSANIVPQELSNNGSDWLRLERYAKALLKRYSDVHVISGPLFLPDAAAAANAASNGPPPQPAHAKSPIRKRISYDVIGAHEVAVPTHLFKVVYASGGPGGDARLSAFVLPNGPLRGHPELDSFVVPLADVERAAGLQLFAQLDGRETLPPLCDGGASRCGVHITDGRIQGWKLLGHLK
eukprot:5920173-Prymnesium_polylepis.1